MEHKFLIHEAQDNVGVVVEDIDEDEQVVGVVLDDEDRIEVKAKGDIPLAHKIATEEIVAGSEIIKYGVVIGRADQDIPEGGYVHDHNISSVRWEND